MDKLFSFNKYFVGFCGLLILAVFAFSFVRDERILAQARDIAQQEAQWHWASQGVTTSVDEIKAKIVKRTDVDAQVEVRGKQKVIVQAPESGGPASAPESSTSSSTNSPQPLAPSATTGATTVNTESDFKAVITLYKEGNSKVWLLGKVEGL